MGTLIRLEMKKIFFKKSIFIVWLGTLFISYISIREFAIRETYADIFNKGYGLVPLMGVIMFMVFSGAYTMEYSSNMAGFIKTTINGKRKLILAKSIAAGISASIINVSIFLTVCISALTKFQFKGLNLPLRELWYFGKSGSELTVLQMILIMIVTIVISSFFFAQIGLFLSSVSKSAAIPFIFGGIIMGIPYLFEGLIKKIGLVDYLGLTPLWGMMSCQLVRFKIPPEMIIILIVIYIAGFIALPVLTYKVFTKER